MVLLIIANFNNEIIDDCERFSFIMDSTLEFTDCHLRLARLLSELSWVPSQPDSVGDLDNNCEDHEEDHVCDRKAEIRIIRMEYQLVSN